MSDAILKSNLLAINTFHGFYEDRQPVNRQLNLSNYRIEILSSNDDDNYENDTLQVMYNYIQNRESSLCEDFCNMLCSGS